jgi:hypothetical protein
MQTIRQPESKRMLGRPRHRWKDNTETAVAEDLVCGLGLIDGRQKKNGKILLTLWWIFLLLERQIIGPNRCVSLVSSFPSRSLSV